MLDFFKKQSKKRIEGPVHSIEVIGSGIGCSACSILHENVKKAVEELGLDVNIRFIDDTQRALEYTSFFAPILIINGEVITKGNVLPVDKIKKILRSADE